jgi:hypothetical protein
LTPSQLYCATVPDGPHCRWGGGSWQRIEAQNKAALREHFRKQAAECLIQPHHPPVNVRGGYEFPNAPKIDLDQKAARTPARESNRTTFSDDLAIPEFLRRAPAGFACGGSAHRPPKPGAL